jgi:hypothetical protein
MHDPLNTISGQLPKLLDQVRDKIRLKHYSIRTEQAYSDWINDIFYILASGIRESWGRRKWSSF